jgi:hypothetical protein
MVTLLRGMTVLLLLASAPVAYFAATLDQRPDFETDVASLRETAMIQVVAPGRAFLEAQLDRRL